MLSPSPLTGEGRGEGEADQQRFLERSLDLLLIHSRKGRVALNSLGGLPGLGGASADFPNCETTLFTGDTANET